MVIGRGQNGSGRELNHWGAFSLPPWGNLVMNLRVMGFHATARHSGGEARK